jgi:hypothetical protein
MENHGNETDMVSTELGGSLGATSRLEELPSKGGAGLGGDKPETRLWGNDGGWRWGARRQNPGGVGG